MAIRPQNLPLPAQGADQHEQRGLGQMEVGQERIDNAETVSGIDEGVGLASARGYRS